MKKKILALFVFLLLMVGMIAPSNVFSAGPLNGNCVDTAIGCVPIGGTFSNWILKWAIGVGSGIAFVLIVYAGFQIITSTGDPERLKSGRDLLTSAISGILLLVFSVFILKFIGVDILGIFS